MELPYLMAIKFNSIPRDNASSCTTLRKLRPIVYCTLKQSHCTTHCGIHIVLHPL